MEAMKKMTKEEKSEYRACIKNYDLYMDAFEKLCAIKDSIEANANNYTKGALNCAIGEILREAGYNLDIAKYYLDEKS